MPGILHPTGRLWTPNRSHPACQGLRFWWKADGRQAVFDLAQRQAFTATSGGNLSLLATGRDDKIGDFLTFPINSGGYNASGIRTAALTSFTFGMMFIPAATSGTERYFVLPSTGAGGLEVYGDFQLHILQQSGGGVQGNNFSPQITAGDPFWVGATGYWNTSIVQMDALAVNLRTGAICTVAPITITNSGAIACGANSGACYLGWDGTNGNNCAKANLSAFVLGSNYIGPRGLQLWAQDPWAAWGAPLQNEWLYSLPAGGSPPPPVTAFGSTLAMMGIG